ncbi:hypothetical protein PROFUN_06996 [Planoprotostelium fungivorum]|uniref:F-box domain-containing protein n=1 Tax=Planoprotostelium fungivorum TaxID=1890364 RepID=A0A2P6NMN2_9EUKA|nr:hypothetical protein PROFUN_06996 [Planoprotostelium fungivorum]
MRTHSEETYTRTSHSEIDRTRVAVSRDKVSTTLVSQVANVGILYLLNQENTSEIDWAKVSVSQVSRRAIRIVNSMEEHSKSCKLPSEHLSLFYILDSLIKAFMLSAKDNREGSRAARKKIWQPIREKLSIWAGRLLKGTHTGDIEKITKLMRIWREKQVFDNEVFPPIEKMIADRRQKREDAKKRAALVEIQHKGPKKRKIEKKEEEEEPLTVESLLDSDASTSNDVKRIKHHFFIGELPLEILLEIMSLLPTKSLLNMLSTCRFMRKLKTEPTIWRGQIKTLHMNPNTAADHYLFISRHSNRSWIEHLDLSFCRPPRTGLDMNNIIREIITAHQSTLKVLRLTGLNEVDESVFDGVNEFPILEELDVGLIGQLSIKKLVELVERSKNSLKRLIAPYFGREKGFIGLESLHTIITCCPEISYIDVRDRIQHFAIPKNFFGPNQKYVQYDKDINEAIKRGIMILGFNTMVDRQKMGYDIRMADGMTSLLLASQLGNTEYARELIKQGENINIRGPMGSVLSLSKSLTIAKMLLEEGAQSYTFEEDALVNTVYIGRHMKDEKHVEKWLHSLRYIIYDEDINDWRGEAIELLSNLLGDTIFMRKFIMRDDEDRRAVLRQTICEDKFLSRVTTDTTIIQRILLSLGEADLYNSGGDD